MVRGTSLFNKTEMEYIKKINPSLAKTISQLREQHNDYQRAVKRLKTDTRKRKIVRRRKM